jgi:hypothetical protein
VHTAAAKARIDHENNDVAANVGAQLPYPEQSQQHGSAIAAHALLKFRLVIQTGEQIVGLDHLKLTRRWFSEVTMTRRVGDPAAAPVLFSWPAEKE